jgi:hypothetical protein
MYLGTNDHVLETARSIRDEEIRNARSYRELRAARRAGRKHSHWTRFTHPVRRSD